jgi:hypothetical protein
VIDVSGNTPVYPSSIEIAAGSVDPFTGQLRKDGVRHVFPGATMRDLAMLHFTAALLSNPAHAERVHDHANRMQVVTAAVDAFMEARKC